MSEPSVVTSDVRHLGDFTFPSAEVTQCPYPFYATLRRESPVLAVPERNEFLVSRREDIMRVLAQPEVFSSEAYRSDARLNSELPMWLAGEECTLAPDSPITTAYNMALSDPPEHGAKRRGAQSLVARDYLASREPAIQAIADELIDGFIDRRAVAFRREFGGPMALFTICALAGFPADDREIFLSWPLSVMHGRRFMSGQQLAEQERAGLAQLEYCKQLILARHTQPEDDFLSRFIADAVARDGGLNIPYLVSEVKLILVAGHETTERLLGNTMLLLLRHPDALARLTDDPTLIPGALEESLRIEAPTQWVSRVCTRDSELGGVPIPAGATVLVLYGSANHDELWDDPAAFRIDRADAQKYHMAFGGGVHRCLGAPVARLEARIALTAFLARLRDIRLDGDPAEVSNIDNFQKRVPVELPLTFRPA